MLLSFRWRTIKDFYPSYAVFGCSSILFSYSGLVEALFDPLHRLLYQLTSVDYVGAPDPSELPFFYETISAPLLRDHNSPHSGFLLSPKFPCPPSVRVSFFAFTFMFAPLFDLPRYCPFHTSFCPSVFEPRSSLPVRALPVRRSIVVPAHVLFSSLQIYSFRARALFVHVCGPQLANYPRYVPSTTALAEAPRRVFCYLQPC